MSQKKFGACTALSQHLFFQSDLVNSIYDFTSDILHLIATTLIASWAYGILIDTSINAYIFQASFWNNTWRFLDQTDLRDLLLQVRSYTRRWLRYETIAFVWNSEYPSLHILFIRSRTIRIKSWARRLATSKLLLYVSYLCWLEQLSCTVS